MERINIIGVIIVTKNVKLCFVASSGGHFEQLMMLSPLMKKYKSIVVTEKTKYRSLNDSSRVYYLNQINRKENRFILSFVWNSVYSMIIFLKEKPDIVITTGALSVIPIALISKAFRKKLVFIESFAKIDSPTLTGKFLYRFADEFYVQWESMLKFYPNALYLGSIY